MAERRFQIIKSEAGWRLRLKAANNKIIVWSEVYVTREGAEHALNLLRTSAQAPVEYIVEENEDASY